MHRMPGRKITPKIFVIILSEVFHGITGSSEAPIVHTGNFLWYHRVLRGPNSTYGEFFWYHRVLRGPSSTHGELFLVWQSSEAPIVHMGTFYVITGSSEAPIVHNGTFSWYHRDLRGPNSTKLELFMASQGPQRKKKKKKSEKSRRIRKNKIKIITKREKD